MSTKAKNKLGKFLYLSLLLYLPFQLALNPTPGIDLASARLLIIAIFLSWLFWSFKNSNLAAPLNLQTLSILGFLFFSLISIAYTENLAWGVRKWLVFASIFPLYLPAWWYLKEKNSLQQTAAYLYTASTLAGLIGIVQFAAQFFIEKKAFFIFWSQKVAPYFLGTAVAETVTENPSWFVEIKGEATLRAISFFPDPHMLSFFVGMILPLGILLFVGSSLKTKIFIGAASAIQLLALFVTFSRAGYLGFIASIAVVGGLVLFKSGPRFRRYALAGGMIALLLLLAVPTLRARFFSTFDLSDKAVAGRIEIWQKAFNVFRMHPVSGVGLGNYAFVMDAGASYRFPIYAHNTYLDIAAETGIVGLFFWLVLLGSAFLTSAGRFLNSKIKKEKIAALSLTGSISYFAVHCFFETPLFSPRILPLLVIIIAATASISKK